MVSVFHNNVTTKLTTMDKSACISIVIPACKLDANCLWQCLCGMGAMVACTTPRCVSCDHATCAVCQAYKQAVNGPEKGDILREPEEGHSLVGEDSFSVPESENFGPEYISGSDISPENVLLQNLTLVGPGDWEVDQGGIISSDLDGGMEANYLDDDDGSPSSEEFTPRSESSESWQEVEDEDGSIHKVDTTLQYLSEQCLSQALDEVFKIWREGILEHNGGQRASSASKPANAAMNGKRPESKRKRGDNFDDEDDRTGMNGPNGKKNKRQRKTMPLETQLACPFFKKDPRRHRACCGFGGQKISYVKQHLNRNHTVSLYCPVCMLYFTDERRRNEHIIARNCERVHQEPEGITLDQRYWLSRRGPSNLNEEQHWYRIFEFLFPGHPRPRSAYNDATFSEEFHQFRDALSEPSTLNLLLSTVRDNPLWTAESEALFGPDLGQGLSSLYWRWTTTTQGESAPFIAVEDFSQAPRAAPTPRIDGGLHQSDLQDDYGPSTSEIPRQGDQAVSENAVPVTLNQREPALYEQVESEATPINADSDREQQKPDDDENPDDVRDSSIGLTPIRHQPRASQTNLPYRSVLEDYAQDTQIREQTDMRYPSTGFQDSGLWSLNSGFGMDDTQYLLEQLRAPHEFDGSDSFGGFPMGPMALTDDDETAIATDFGDFAVVARPPE